MLDTENNDEHTLLVIYCFCLWKKYGSSIVSRYCQSLHAKFDYIRLLIDKFMQKDCPLQAISLQETCFF